MTFWPLTSYSDSPTNQTSNQFHDLDTELDLHWITSGFHGAFATSVACQQETLILPVTLFRPRPPIFGGLAYTPIVETSFPKLAVSFLDFSLRILLVIFSILLWILGRPVHYSAKLQRLQRKINADLLTASSITQPQSIWYILLSHVCWFYLYVAIL